MFKFFDAHSHLNLKPIKNDQDRIIQILESKNVGTVTIGTDKASSKEAVELAKKSKNLFAGVGLHPTDVMDEEFDTEYYRDLAKDEKVVCIGECGLDYFRLGDKKEEQDKLFRDHVELALELDLPLMLHIRSSKGTTLARRSLGGGGDAYEDCISILKEYKKEYGDKLRGNSHFFAGNARIAEQFVELGFSVSFAGPITFTDEYNNIIRSLPLDMILSETDSPFAAPVPYRGKTCEPQYVEEVVKRIAEIRGEDFETVKRAMVKNALRVFDIKSN